MFDLVNVVHDLLFGPVDVDFVVEALLDDAVDEFVDRRIAHRAAVGRKGFRVVGSATGKRNSQGSLGDDHRGTRPFS
jgi:hypothetical protein